MSDAGRFHHFGEKLNQYCVTSGCGNSYPNSGSNKTKILSLLPFIAFHMAKSYSQIHLYSQPWQFEAKIRFICNVSCQSCCSMSFYSSYSDFLFTLRMKMWSLIFSIKLVITISQLWRGNHARISLVNIEYANRRRLLQAKEFGCAEMNGKMSPSDRQWLIVSGWCWGYRALPLLGYYL